MAKLKIEAGRGMGKMVEFEKQAVIGRGETATLQIGDVKASREHCKVFDQGGTWVVADLNSRNGIKVNSIVTTRKNLSAGDRIEVGETVIVFDPSGAPAAAKAAATPPAGSAAPPAAAAPPRAEEREAPAPRRSASGPVSDVAAKKAAAMAEARASVAKDTASRAAARQAATTAKTATKEADKGLQVSDRVLQYNRIDAKKATLLDVDMGQSPFLVKLGVWAGCLALLGVVIWAVSMMM